MQRSIVSFLEKRFFASKFIGNLYALTCMFAPYTDTSLWPTFDISTVPGVTDFTLGFVVADYNKQPSWGGYYEVDSDYYGNIIRKIKKQGGKLICSFGGADGAELATVYSDPNELFGVYDSVIRKYNFRYVDFDIEGGTLLDVDANKRRAIAIRNLKKKYKDLHVSLTVPVMPRGLDKHALDLINKTPHDLVNIMAMDFGSEPNMYRAVVDAIHATRDQISSDLGVTVMIGKNDTVEVFTLLDAKLLADFIKQNSFVKRVSFWSIERDAGKLGDLAHSSKIIQLPWAFSNFFNKIY